MKLLYSKSTEVEHAYIITIKGNELSERYAKQCRDSCDAVGMPYITWDAYDGHTDTITEPEQVKNSDFMNIVKVTNHHLTRSELACTLSHISLWAHCATIDKPIVILEHDAYMVKKFTTIESYNAIVWLGSREWVEQNWTPHPIPPHATNGPNFHFALRAHAYAIDPPMAKNLMAHVLEMGVYIMSDWFLRADLFNITHQGLYAYDKHFIGLLEDSTIKRVKPHEHKELNVNLSY